MTTTKMKPRVLFILHLPPPVHGASIIGSYIRDSRYINESFVSDFVNLSSSTSLNQIGKGGLKKQYQILRIVLKVYGLSIQASIECRKGIHHLLVNIDGIGSGAYTKISITDGQGYNILPN